MFLYNVFSQLDAPTCVKPREPKTQKKIKGAPRLAIELIFQPNPAGLTRLLALRIDLNADVKGTFPVGSMPEANERSMRGWIQRGQQVRARALKLKLRLQALTA